MIDIYHFYHFTVTTPATPKSSTTSAFKLRRLTAQALLKHPAPTQSSGLTAGSNRSYHSRLIPNVPRVQQSLQNTQAARFSDGESNAPAREAFVHRRLGH